MLISKVLVSVVGLSVGMLGFAVSAPEAEAPTTAPIVSVVGSAGMLS